MTTYDRIRVLWPDQFGLARGKYLPVRLAERGTGHCVTTFGTQYDKTIIPAPGSGLLEGLPDVDATYDPHQVRRGWDDDATGVVVADLSMHGQPFPYAARSRLQAALDDWRALGYGVKVGIELEAYVLERADDGDLDIGGERWRRWRTPRSFVYGTGRTADPVGLLSEITRRAERSGLPVESINSEFDEGQFELTLEVDDAMKAADDAFLFRVLAREVALEHGLDLTFLGKPFAGISGSGVHVNFSLVDHDGSNAFDEPTGADALSPIVYRCLAGLVAHHRALTALCAPTVNAYRRLRPGELCGYWATWGHDHRVAANRVPPHRGGATRIENRIADGSASIHLAIAAVLQAARLGVIDDLECPAPLVDDGFETVNTDVCAASDLSAALDDLEADGALVAAVGEELVANFVANKRAEWERYTEAVGAPDDGISDWELNEYLPFH
jgi:glutamine synthetase